MGDGARLNIDQLLLLSLSELTNNGQRATFENLVVKCFELYPTAFGLKGFAKKHPDSSRVNKSWLRCRTDKGWISGSVAHGFAVTSLGTKELNRIKRTLEQTGAVDDDLMQYGDKRTKSGRIIERIERHKTFAKYKQGKKRTRLSDYEVCDLLFCTLDSFVNTRRKNLEEMKNLVAVYERKDLLAFLEWIEEDKKYLFINHEFKERSV